jgi:hypothetical protein
MCQPVPSLGAALVLFSLACGGDPESPDTQPPNIIFVSPREELVFETVTIAVMAEDDRAVAGVQFWLNGAKFGPEDQTEPYSTTWNTLEYADGFYTLRATARDFAGNHSSTVQLEVRVINGP